MRVARRIAWAAGLAGLWALAATAQGTGGFQDWSDHMGWGDYTPGWQRPSSPGPMSPLSVGDARALAEDWLAWRGLSGYTVGEITETGSGFIVAVETPDGAAPSRLLVDRHSGTVRPLP